MGYDQISSGTAYREAAKSQRDYARQQVFIAIRKLQPCNDKQISEYLGWPINRVTPRRGELVSNNLIVQNKKDIDPATKRTVSYWMERPVNFQPTLF